MLGHDGGFAVAARAAFTFEQLMTLSGLPGHLRDQGPADSDGVSGWCVLFENEALQAWAYGRCDGTVSLRLFPMDPEAAIEMLRARAPSLRAAPGVPGEIRAGGLTPARAARAVELVAGAAANELGLAA